MSRLGSKMAFSQAVEEIWESHQVAVAESTLRYTTYRHGRAAEAVVRQEVERLEKEAPAVAAQPEKLVISVDGAFVPLVGGEWREVKSVAIGQVSQEWSAKEQEMGAKTTELSYFSRSYRVREFERAALAELYHRGLTQAQTVIAINDGAPWIQGFIDYHAPQAVRIIDFAHTQSYLAQAGKAVWGEDSPHFPPWYAAACHRLKHKPIQHTLANLRLLQPKAQSDEQSAQLDTAIFYIHSRQEMMDYPRFRRLGYPLGSGSVESGHKVVAHARLKGPGMRWAPHHVDPLLALRNLLANNKSLPSIINSPNAAAHARLSFLHNPSLLLPFRPKACYPLTI